MKMYFNGRMLDTMTVYLPLITNYFRLSNGYKFEEYEFDSKKLNEIMSGIAKLGLKIRKVTIPCGGFLNVDNKFYRRYPDETIEKMVNTLSNWHYGEAEVQIKNGRLYYAVDGYTIILPKDYYTDYDKREIRLSIYFE